MNFKNLHSPGSLFIALIFILTIIGTSLPRLISIIPHVHAASSVGLSWDVDQNSTDNISIYRSNACLSAPNSSLLLATVSQLVGEYIDTSATPGITYTYTIFAVATDGTYSDPSCVTFSVPAQSSSGGSSSGSSGSNTTDTSNSGGSSSPSSGSSGGAVLSSGGGRSGATNSQSSAQLTDTITLLVLQNKDLFLRAEAAGIALPRNILNIIHGVTTTYVSPTTTTGTPSSGTGVYYRDLTVGSSGSDVLALQKFLIAQNKGPEARALRSAGANGNFGNLTKYALAEYQYAVGIVPSTGYFGPTTRARVQR